MTINHAPSLYRGKLLTVDGEYSWLYGDYLTMDGRSWILPPDQYEESEVQPNTVGLWTGLTDKNDTEIFEGDIVRIGTGTFIVAWNVECAGFQLFRDDTWYGSINCFYKDVEIVGNVFDSPEALQ